MSSITETKHTAGAVRAAKLIARSEKLRPLVFGGILREEAAEHFAAIIDSETLLPTLIEALVQADLQIEYLQSKFKETGSGNSVRAQIQAAINLSKFQ